MPTLSNTRGAGHCEKLVGRRSRLLAPPFIEQADIADGDYVIELGYGTGHRALAGKKGVSLVRITPEVISLSRLR